MASIESRGIFADTKSAGGLYRGTETVTADTANGPNRRNKIPGAPIENVSQREWTSRFTDFTVATDQSEMVTTDIGSVTTETIEFGAAGGRVGLWTHDTANEGFGSIQQALWGFTAVAGRTIVFEASVSNADWTESDWFIGFGEVDTTFMSLAGALAANGADNFVGFTSLDTSATVTLSSAGIALANRQDTTLGEGVDYNNSTVSQTLTDATFHQFGIRIEGTTGIEFYVDGKLVHVRTSDDAFAEIMVPTFTMLAGGAENAFNIDWFNMAATR